jgi:hypothetical protein
MELLNQQLDQLKLLNQLTYNKKGQLNHVYDMLLHPRLELLVLMVKSNQLVHSLVPPTGVVDFPSDALGAFASST